MQVIVGRRRSGKTHKLVEWLKEDPQRVLICHSYEEKRLLVRLYDLADEQVATTQSLGLRGNNWGFDKTFAIDNLDLVLPQLLGAQVDTVALTGEVRK